MGIIFNIQKFCIHDGDGIRTCVFLKGCPLNCIWCHNPEGISELPSLSFTNSKCTLCGSCLSDCSCRTIKNGALAIDRQSCIKCGKCAQICLNGANEIIGKYMTATQVMEEVIKDKMFYDSSGGGLTVTGGEPSYRADFTLELLQLSKAEGISATIETCGIGSRDFYKKAADLSATFLFDIKCMDSALHQKLTGVPNTRILDNLNYLMGRNADIIIRLPLIPDCNDSDDCLLQLATFLNENKGRYRYAEIMPYHALGSGKAEKLGITPAYTHETATDENISRWCSLFTSSGIDIKVSE